MTLYAYDTWRCDQRAQNMLMERRRQRANKARRYAAWARFVVIG